MKTETRKSVAHVKRAMGRSWRTLWHIQSEVTAKHGWMAEQTVSARVRDLRKEEYGSHDIRRRYAGGGVWEYKNFGKRK
jgi:hypothetical protein